ncbi:MAG: hypothetical protein O2960_10690 [Verrucomicrobia bacterium]|nr:hypothetical protein [Verrucomicrobiota bacterium]
MICSFKLQIPGLSAMALFLFLCISPLPAGAHHFKGLPHYNYFENYPQVPEEEFLGRTGEYELSLVVYDFQGINRKDVQDPDKVRLFLLIFSLDSSKVYQGPLTLEILDRGKVMHSARHASADLENIYSLHQDLPGTGRYALRVTLHDEQDITCEIPFRLSSQTIHWGKWIGLALFTLITVTAIGGRKARIALDRKEAHQRAKTKGSSVHA